MECRSRAYREPKERKGGRYQSRLSDRAESAMEMTKKRTVSISASDIEPCRSCLLAKTSSEAPASRYHRSCSGMKTEAEYARGLRQSQGKMNGGRLHLRLAGCEVHPCSPPFASCPRNRQPRQARPFVQSSCANRAGACVGHRRPLGGSERRLVSILESRRTDVQDIPWT